MKDKSLAMWLIGMFGISGTALIVLAWLLPAPVSERIMVTLAGLVGVSFAVVRYLMLRREPAEQPDNYIPLRVEVKEKQ